MIEPFLKASPNNFYRLVQGDNLKVLSTLEDESIDLIVTDPQYGIGFMGKDWDKALPPVETWIECLRVLKSGAFAFIMSSPRMDCLGEMSRRLQLAGFNVGFTPIYWTYASGFPKSENISKNVDRRLGLEREIIGKYRPPEMEEEWNLKQSKDKTVKGSGGTFTSSNRRISDITQPSSEEAKKLDGSFAGYQPKPALEVIIVAMRPIKEKTYLDQALKNQKGITWLDDCRLPINPKVDDMLRTVDRKQRVSETWEEGSGFKNENNSLTGVRSEGRFPANLLISDDVLNDGKITKGSPVGFKNVGWKHSGNTKDEMTSLTYQNEFNDSGSFSRYFDLDAWFSERIKKLPKEIQKTFPFLIVPKASKSERDRGLEGFELKTIGQSAKNRVWTDKCGNCGLKFIGGEPRCHCVNKVTSKEDGYKYKNIHPTVKPLKLMSYLIILGSREGNIVLDPFLGSGTTMLASIILNRSCVGVELNEEYCKIARARCFKNTLDSSERYSFEVME